jgi:hypothetical protein
MHCEETMKNSSRLASWCNYVPMRKCVSLGPALCHKSMIDVSGSNTRIAENYSVDSAHILCLLVGPCKWLNLDLRLNLGISNIR